MCSQRFIKAIAALPLQMQVCKGLPPEPALLLSCLQRPAPLLPYPALQISLLRVADRGSVRSVADVVGRVEADGSAGNVFVVRLFEAEGSPMILSKEMQASSDTQRRLKMLLAACVDVPTIMQTMPNAIRNAVVMSR
jgi:hypothetical protein